MRIYRIPAVAVSVFLALAVAIALAPACVAKDKKPADHAAVSAAIAKAQACAAQRNFEGFGDDTAGVLQEAINRALQEKPPKPKQSSTASSPAVQSRDRISIISSELPPANLSHFALRPSAASSSFARSVSANP